ncbi:hypothetical protein TRVL_01205 [Trypanosoma vivax]|nr:hypothetical protein TRVL_01205 [Trypanosoma vivax]
MQADHAKFHVGPLSSFKNGSRQLIKCGKRNIAVYFYNDSFFALDNACYHHGGPLLEGDIEDMGGHPCVVCPWHRYPITLDTGESLYWALQMSPSGIPDKGAPKVLRSKGRRQRTHHVTVENGDVFVTLNTSESPVESDKYAQMDIANKEKSMSGPITCTKSRFSDLHSSIRSGEVFARSSLGKDRNVVGRVREPYVLCVRTEDVCNDTKEFFFQLVQGVLEAPPHPGQFVDLRLPVNDGLGRSLNRCWTVVECSDSGSAFSLIIKASAESKGGSSWMLNNALHQRFALLRVGGRFTFGHNIARILALRGRVVILSAGIGVTAPYASLREFLDGGRPMSGNKELDALEFHIKHLHVDRTVLTLAKKHDFIRWHNTESTRFVYRFHCFFTQQRTETMEDELLKPLASCGRRPQQEDVHDHFSQFVERSPAVAFVSGPPEFVRMSVSALLSLGMLESDILTDEMDINSIQT